MSKFTGNRDTDLIILSQLTDKDLGIVCQVNKYVEKLCEDENFWRNRLFNNNVILINLAKEFFDAFKSNGGFEKLIYEIKEFLEFSNWKQLYIFLFHSEYLQLNLKTVLRESIVRFFHLTEVDRDEIINRFSIKTLQKHDPPNWIDLKIMSETLKRDYFFGLGRGLKIADIKGLFHTPVISFIGKI